MILSNFQLIYTREMIAFTHNDTKMSMVHPRFILAIFTSSTRMSAVAGKLLKTT